MTGTQNGCRQGGRRAGPAMVILVLFVITAAFTPGCIKIMQQAGNNDKSPADASTIPTNQLNAGENTAENQITSVAAGPLPPFPDGQQTISPPQTPISAPVIGPSQPTVCEVTPIPTPDSYPVLHGTRFNTTQAFNRLGGTNIEFEKTYVLTGNAISLLVNVTKAPLYIVYEVTPQNDCLMNPDSCRGDKTKTVNRPYLTITVRDNSTKEIVAEDGYGGEYSSDTGHATYSNTGKNTGDSLLSSATYRDVTTTSSPGPRYIKIFREGTFHVTLEGIFLSVDVKIRTGTTPDKAESTAQSSSSPAPDNTIPPEILQRIQQGV